MTTGAVALGNGPGIAGIGTAGIGNDVADQRYTEYQKQVFDVFHGVDVRTKLGGFCCPDGLIRVKV